MIVIKFYLLKTDEGIFLFDKQADQSKKLLSICYKTSKPSTALQ